MILNNYPRLKASLKYCLEVSTGYWVRWHLPTDGKPSWEITFDDGPLPNTRHILAVLDDFQMKATFFMVAKRMLTYPDIVAEVVSKGHTIGSHGYDHIVLKKLPLPEFRRQIKASFAVIETLAGPQPRIFRPPWGQISPWQTAWLLRQGIKVVFWSHQLADDHSALVEPCPAWTPCGPIILFHDYDKIEVLNQVISICREINNRKL